MKTLKGIIIKGTGGFYYVEVADSVYECRARGILRKMRITPVVGDICQISVPENGVCMVESIEERKNLLVRPPLANLDRLFIIVSACDPAPNALLIDRMIASAEDKGIEPVLVFTKNDLADAEEYFSIYSKAGFTAIKIDYNTGEGIEQVRALLAGCVSGFAGNSGVGKSTLLNALEPTLNLQTGEISRKLGRGRHTTRTAELFSLCGGRIADTAGFSSFDDSFGDAVSTENLPYAFREFADYLGKCKFTSCAHVCEKGCAVLEAVRAGEIAQSRHESYCALYQEAKDRKDW